MLPTDQFKTSKIYVHDDCALLVDGLRAFFNGNSEFAIVRRLKRSGSMLENAKVLRPKIVLLNPADDKELLESAPRELSKLMPSASALLLTKAAEKLPIQKIVELGYRGWVDRDDEVVNVARALNIVIAGGYYFNDVVEIQNTKASSSDEIAARLPSGVQSQVAALVEDDTSKLVESLSDREEVVIRRVALGFCNKVIANDIDVSTKTVETYKSRAMSKLDLPNRAALVQFAIQSGWMRESA